MGYQSVSYTTHASTTTTVRKRAKFCNNPPTPPKRLTSWLYKKHAQNSTQGRWRNSGWKLADYEKQKQPSNTPNITKEEYRAIKQHREDQSRIVLTANKGVAMVIMDKQQLHGQGHPITTLHQYLQDHPQGTPPNKLKNKLIGILKDIKQTGGLKDTTYCKVYPTSVVPPKFYDLPKIHKVGTPLRSIVSSMGSITYGVAKELGRHHMSTSKSITTPS